MSNPATAPRPTILPEKGTALVKNVLSGDTVILLGKATGPNGKAPEVVFTLESIVAPRMASKANANTDEPGAFPAREWLRKLLKANANTDEPGAFPAREWLRKLLVGKTVQFETRKQGTSAGDRVYGLVFYAPPGDTAASPMNVAVEVVRNGGATPKSVSHSQAEAKPDEANAELDDYQSALLHAYEEAKKETNGIHAAQPLVRSLKNAGDDFETLQLVQLSQKLGQHGKVRCVVEYIFDGSRLRCQVIDPVMGDFQFGSFTMLLAGVSSPRVGNSRTDPPTPSEPFADEARQFVELRLLQRELEISLCGTDKAGVCAVGIVHHPKGNIAVELLKNGLAKISDWSLRQMAPHDVPALRIAENSAKRTNTKIWHSYAPPKLRGASEIIGTVVEVLSGDTLAILPSGQAYDSEDVLQKVSLASVRSPRVGNERLGREDEPYSHECKDRLRVMTVGKPCKVQIHYERDIPVGETTDRRQFGTVSTKQKPDVAEVLLAEGLATTQRHRDDDEKSPRYDDLRAAESAASSAKKGLHSEKEYKRGTINDLTDPRKAKAYSGALMRAKTIKSVVEYCFSGARFKMLVPSENCHIVFSPNCIRCPQPSPAGAGRQGRPAEPFGDASKRHARLTVHQRTVEIVCSGVTMGGVITGTMYVGQGGQRRDYGLEIVGAGLGTVDQKKIDYGEAPKQLIDAQNVAKQSRIGLWSIERPVEVKQVKTPEKFADQIASIRVSEIRSGSHFFFHTVNDEAVQIIDESMKLFTTNNGTAGAPCDVKNGKVVAALFDDGSGKSWYRAKIVEKRGPKATVLFVDHGNLATVPIATHLRPIDNSLGTDRIPAVAKEAVLALVVTRPLSSDEGVEAARMFQSLCWGMNVTAKIHGTDDNGKMALNLLSSSGESVGEQLVSSGFAMPAKAAAVQSMSSRMVDGTAVLKLAAELEVAKESARKTRSGMWRYGDVGDDDDDYA
eukprot:CAMPEP_0119573206 /NCGR_PEP_ID=MMETSP1352-20130426/45005_1 /TAXON_ID=265584 /ORGANISM="Stauroneis constricta, Strain CCMP1120" /LENGTH=958 /DNA_ID=CAMNT_0007622893 /DNA_START=199 /DNA_END=3075 /DNA_ORIENTATION=-